jgi:flagellar motility protein MotE (MotC chaperone)
MKNFLILGLLAVLLFSISAGLSVWLNQSKHQADKSAEKEQAGKEPDKSNEKGPKGEPKDELKVPVKAETPPPSGVESTAKKMSEREARIQDRAERVELVVRDIQSQRESNESLVRQVLAELKNTAGEKTKLDSLLADLNKKTIEINSLEDANIVKLAAMYDALSPEAASQILKEMAEKGRMDTAAKIMVKMKDRNSARVLEVMEPSLAAQLLERMLRLRAPTPAPPPKAP